MLSTTPPLDARSARATEMREMVRLALPVVVVQVGMMMMGVVDTLMVGRVSEVAIAAVALGNLYFFSLAVGGMGVLMSLDPVVAQAVGAHDEPAVARGVQRSVLMALALTVPTSLCLIPGERLLTALGQPAEVASLAAAYGRASIPGVLGFYLFVVFRQSLQALARMRPIVIVIVAANLANVVLDWAWIFGHLGLPALGAIGTAWATSICRWLLALGLLAAAFPTLRHQLWPIRPETFEWQPLLRMARLGLPIGAQYSLEYGVFATIALLMGWLGPRALAGHQIAINLASLTFMVPLGVSAAAAVRVGHAVGRGDPPGARRAAAAALLLGVGFMTTTAVLFLAFPGPLARLYTAETGPLAMAALLIPIAGFFQVFDGTQVVATGILRGLGDTHAPMWVNVVGFWLIGLPVSLLLGFTLGLGPAGMWWGFVAGLGSVAVVLVARVRVRLRRAMPRVLIDDAPAG